MITSPLHVIQEEVRFRVEQINSAYEREHAAWPCRKGCDECCRRLASYPLSRKRNGNWSLLTWIPWNPTRRPSCEGASGSRQPPRVR